MQRITGEFMNAERHRPDARTFATQTQPGMRLLLIEDDLEAASYLVKGLRENGYGIDHSADGRDGLERAMSGGYDVIIADRQLPELDGLSIIVELRKKADRTPVLILSALGTVDDRVHGLKAGGDDYLTKPFAFAELLARVEALSRRASAHVETTRLKVADLELDLLARRVTRAGRNIDLTAKEFQLLEYLMRRPDQVVTRTMLLEGVWNLQFDPQTNIIDVHMSRLRTAIDKNFAKPLIHTVRGAGYMLKTPESL
jgi:two-component system OmpR family response regulator